MVRTTLGFISPQFNGLEWCIADYYHCLACVVPTPDNMRFFHDTCGWFCLHTYW